VDPNDPGARGLVYCTLANTPGRAVDLVGAFDLPFVSTATLDVNAQSGVGLRTDAGGEGAKAVIPAYLRISTLTLIWRGVVLGAGDAAVLAGSWFSAIETNPYPLLGDHGSHGHVISIRAEWNDGSYNASLNLQRDAVRTSRRVRF
jgi:hypothetical protein